MMNVKLTLEELNKVSGGHFNNGMVSVCKCMTFLQYVKNPAHYKIACELIANYGLDEEFHTVREYLETLKSKGFISIDDYRLGVDFLEKGY